MANRCITIPLCLLILAGCEPEEDPPELQMYELGGDFSLTDHNDRPFALESLRGRVVLMFFGYTHCPDYCPMILSKLASVQKLLGTQKPFQTLFVTIDPVRDTAELLKQYVDSFRMDITGLTGSEVQLRDVAANYGASFRKASIGREPADSDGPTRGRPGYLMEHSTRTYLIDRQGVVRHLFSSEDDVGEIAIVLGQLY